MEDALTPVEGTVYWRLCTSSPGAVTVIGGLFGDGDIVWVALPQTGIGDLHESGFRFQFRDGGGAAISHGGTNSAQ